MIRILITDRCITASGHAGIAPYGRDLVCAGVSSLLWALAGVFPEGTVLRPGYGCIRVPEGEFGRGALAAAEAGLRLIAGEYPGAVEITKPTNTQRKEVDR